MWSMPMLFLIVTKIVLDGAIVAGGIVGVGSLFILADGCEAAIAAIMSIKAKIPIIM
jgi:hypothetical protein